PCSSCRCCTRYSTTCRLGSAACGPIGGRRRRWRSPPPDPRSHLPDRWYRRRRLLPWRLPPRTGRMGIMRPAPASTPASTASTADAEATAQPEPTYPPQAPYQATHHPFLFATGIECSAPVITAPDGSRRRVDELAKTHHYERWREDFALVRDLGLANL